MVHGSGEVYSHANLAMGMKDGPTKQWGKGWRLFKGKCHVAWDKRNEKKTILHPLYTDT